MKVVVYTRYGGADDVLGLQDIDLPDITDDDVLVRVAATALNPLHWPVMRPAR